MVQGYYFTYSEKDPIRFNPFYIAGGELPDTEKKESIKTLVLALWKKDNETFARSEYVALSNALQGYYEKLANDKKIFPGFDSFYEFLQNDFAGVLQQEGSGKEILTWPTCSMYSGLITGEGNLIIY